MATNDDLLMALVPDTSLVVILRPGDYDKYRERGEVVDSSGWRRASTLLERRFVAYYTGREPFEVEYDGEIRRFINSDVAEAAIALLERRKPPVVVEEEVELSEPQNTEGEEEQESGETPSDPPDDPPTEPVEITPPDPGTGKGRGNRK